MREFQEKYDEVLEEYVPVFNKKNLLSLLSNDTSASKLEQRLSKLQQKLNLFIETASKHSQEYAGKFIRERSNLNKEYKDVIDKAYEEYEAIRRKRGNAS